jgi:5-methylcytosine-specific restriction protein B
VFDGSAEETAMSFADDVREHCRVNYVEPGRTRGDSTITIRAGDVHSALGYKNRYPLVCSSLGATTFEESCRVKRVAVDGPLNGANTVFTFQIL